VCVGLVYQPCEGHQAPIYVQRQQIIQFFIHGGLRQPMSVGVGEGKTPAKCLYSILFIYSINNIIIIVYFLTHTP